MSMFRVRLEVTLPVLSLSLTKQEASRKDETNSWPNYVPITKRGSSSLVWTVEPGGHVRLEFVLGLKIKVLYRSFQPCDVSVRTGGERIMRH